MLETAPARPAAVSVSTVPSSFARTGAGEGTAPRPLAPPRRLRGPAPTPLPGRVLSASFNASKAKKSRAFCGADRATFAPLPRKSARQPCSSSEVVRQCGGGRYRSTQLAVSDRRFPSQGTTAIPPPAAVAAPAAGQ